MISRLLCVVILSAGLHSVSPAASVAQERTEQQEKGEESDWITVRPGDTLFSLSRRHDLRIQDLRSWNNISGSAIRAGMRLRISPPTNQPALIEEATSSDAKDSSLDIIDVVEEDSLGGFEKEGLNGFDVGTVTPLGGGMVAVSLGAGETLFSLASQYALSVDSLMTINPGLPASLEAGMVIIVPDDRVARTRMVRPGDTLFKIAQEEGVSLGRLREMNGISGSALRVGQELTVPSGSVESNRSMNLPEAGTFSIRPYPDALLGRTLSTGRTFENDDFLIGHPALPPGSVVLVSTDGGMHAFAEVIETAPARNPVFIEGSRKLFETLSLTTGDRVSLHLVR